MIKQIPSIFNKITFTIFKLFNLIILLLLSKNKLIKPYQIINKNFLTDRQTILHLKNNPKVGIIRNGNSELGLIVGNSPRTQKYNKELKNKLIKICRSYTSFQMKKYLLALPLDSLVKDHDSYFKRNIPKWYPGTASRWAMRFLVKSNQIYASPFCFRIFNVIDDDIDGYIKLIKSLFIDRKIIYVGPLEGKNPDIPDFISPAAIIKIPEKNAFEKFDFILSQIKDLCKKFKDPLVIIVGGITASAISYELNIANITCYDFGQYNRLYKKYLQSKIDNKI